MYKKQAVGLQYYDNTDLVFKTGLQRVLIYNMWRHFVFPQNCSFGHSLRLCCCVHFRRRANIVAESCRLSVNMYLVHPTCSRSRNNCCDFSAVRTGRSLFKLLAV